MHLIQGIHPRGYGFYNQKKNIFLVGIPKVGTGSLRTICNQRDDWVVSNLHQISEPKEIIIILRDPVERFLSAFNTHILSGKSTYVDSFYINRLFDKPDVHLMEQVVFVHGIIRAHSEKIKYFYYNKNVFHEIDVYYNGIGFQRMPLTNTSGNFVQMIDKDRVKPLYDVDYELINNVTFINRGPK